MTIQGKLQLLDLSKVFLMIGIMILADLAIFIPQSLEMKMLTVVSVIAASLFLGILIGLAVNFPTKEESKLDDNTK